MSPRTLYADHGRRGEFVKTPEQQALVDGLMDDLIAKAEQFLDGKYLEPSAES
ncbi:hypothetical protein ACFQAT_28175 [Undibacterium arcticum]|uniref:Uncharacterized protein n=1 Tax=Undibacterium arcticum TaxID=1762892 RepID=A0ABV7F624_9BURK